MQTDITQYIPQRSPFVMVDAVLEATDTLSKTSFTITPDNILVKDGLLTESGLVENMAQTAAACTGYKAQQENKPVQIGYIGALKNLSVTALPKVGTTLTTEVAFTNQIMNVHIVQGKVFDNGELIASCELKIFLQS